MSEHFLVRKKGEYDERYTLADQPLTINATGKLSSNMMKKIAAKKSPGYVVTFDEILDGYDDLKKHLTQEIKYNYSPPTENFRDDELAFLLLDAKISNIHTPVEKSGLQLGGTLAMPSITGLSFPVDEQFNHWNEKPGKWKKVYDLNKSRNFVLGKPHAFKQTMKFNKMDTHSLIEEDSLVNHKLLFPNAESILPTGKPLLYAHEIDDQTMYGLDELPTISEVTKATDAGTFENVTFVFLPESSFSRQWHKKFPQYNTEGGAKVPIEEHVLSSYKFSDNIYHNRCTTFDKSGMVFNARMTNSEAPVLFDLVFNIHPIVPFHENMEMIPYLNYKKHAEASFPKI